MRIQRYLLSMVAFGVVVTIAPVAWAGEITLNPTSGSPSTSTHVGSTGTITFNVANGPSANSVSAVGESGTHCNEFALTTPTIPPDRVLNGNTNEDWTVTFTPSSGNRGARGPCRFTLTHEATNNDFFDASGTATQPNMGSSTPNGVAFGDTEINLASPPTRTITLTNLAPSNETLNYTIDISGAGAAAYSVNDPNGGVLVQGASTVLTVTFDPSTTGTQNATVTINGDDIANSSDPYNFTGNGVDAIMGTSITGTTFGSAHVNVASTTTRTITITNGASANTNLDWTSSFGADPSEWVAVPASGTIPPNNSTNVVLTFTPSGRGSRADTVTISSDDGENPNDSFDLTGTGTSGNMVLTWSGSPGTLDFGDVPLAGATSTRDVTITNQLPGANEDLVLSAVGITAGGSDYSESDSPVTLAPGESLEVTITFNPGTAGDRDGTFTVSGNDALNPSDTVSLTGNGTTSILSVAMQTPFPSIKVGSNNTGTVRLDNTAVEPGAHDLTITSLSMATGDATMFSFTDHGCTGQTCNLGGSPIVLTAASTADFVIRCTPTARGNRTTTLTVTGNQESGTNTLTLTCPATDPEINVTDT
jgi:hypothetical protein